MKKIIVIVLVLLILGYAIFQNGALIALKLLSFNSGVGSNVPSANGSSSPKPPFKDGRYTGNSANAFYGNIQVQVNISGGKISDVQFLQHPDHATRSIAINTVAMPNLKQEAIQAQSADVNIVSGATDSSNAFIQSLSSALTQAK